MNSTGGSDTANLRTISEGPYLPALLTRIRALHPDFPLDIVILNSLLLSLVAPSPSTSINAGETAGKGGGLHVILRTKDEDVSLVTNLANLILTTLFGLHTHKHAIERPSSSRSSRNHRKTTVHDITNVARDPVTFLRAFFFRRPSFSHRSTSHSRRSADTTPSKDKDASQYSFTRASRRSSSYPTVTEGTEKDAEDTRDCLFDGGSMASSRRVFTSGQLPTAPSTIRSRSSRMRPQAPRLPTDPLPLLATFEPSAATESPSLNGTRRPSNQSPKIDRSNIPVDGDATARAIATLPKAVVVSGLEHASLAGQRALSQTLADKRLILDDEMHTVNGTWNFPEDFMVIYVCAGDAQEHPPILRALLDKFALSADIAISPDTKRAYAAYRAAYATSPYASPLSSPRLLSPSPPTYDSLLSNGSSSIPPRLRPPSSLSSPPAPVVSSVDLSYLRALAAASPSTHAHAYTAMQPSLRAYLGDLFSATRHHPELDGTLLTHRAHVDAEALVRAFRVLAGDSIGAGLIHTAAERAGAGDRDSDIWYSSEAGHSRAPTDESDVSSPEQDFKSPLKIEVDGLDLDLDAEEQWEGTPARAESATIAPPGPPEVWDVSEVDIARIFPRVVSHRVRVRDGPEDEVLGSLVWPAVDLMPDGEPVVPENRTWTRRSVKEILVGILADV